MLMDTWVPHWPVSHLNQRMSAVIPIRVGIITNLFNVYSFYGSFVVSMNFMNRSILSKGSQLEAITRPHRFFLVFVS